MYSLSPACFEAPLSLRRIFFFFPVSVFWRNLLIYHALVAGCWLLVVGDQCIQPALVFCGENQSNVVIVVSDRLLCFAVRSDQILVDQVFDKFSTSLEVFLNYLVICFESLYCVLQVVLA
jgi:hypothetical protein